ncbi:hypothetical protein ABIA33_006803 [Streptacidiphilus sp. MAP12-16]|jgi:hypothetical protein
MKGYQSGDVPTTAREGIVRLVGLVEWLQARQSDQAAPSVGGGQEVLLLGREGMDPV